MKTAGPVIPVFAAVGTPFGVGIVIGYMTDPDDNFSDYLISFNCLCRNPFVCADDPNIRTSPRFAWIFKPADVETIDLKGIQYVN